MPQASLSAVRCMKLIKDTEAIILSQKFKEKFS